MQAQLFLMFSGQAEEAFRFYAEVFPDCEILQLERYGPSGPGLEGTMMRGRLRLAGLDILGFDSFVNHDFTFTPASSIFVTCDTEDEIVRLANVLAEGGNLLMPLDNYGFSRQFAWLNDRFGVSWQLTLP